jgi:lipopolysaccharide transport system ATP-binding protein
MTEIAIKVENLSKCYQVYDKPQDRLLQMLLFGRKQYFREFWALKDISFEINKGETVGIIGRNGSGKSTILQIICGTLNPTGGSIQTNGRIAALLELGSGFNPEFTGRENVYMNGIMLGLDRNEIDARFDEIASFADIGEFIEQPVKTYSSGMFVRLAFAVQAHIDASIVVIDEALAVGDIFFRQKCYARLEQLRSSGAAILLVSHSMGDIEQHCGRVLLLDHGHAVRIGTAAEAIKEYYLLEQSSRLSTDFAAINTELLEHDSTQTLFFPTQAALPLDKVSQINAFNARCLRIALTDINGEPRRSFRVGETAVFHHEHYVGDYNGIPVGGVILHTEKGIILHGKSSIQTRMDEEPCVTSASTVLFKHSTELLIAPGEYSFDIGMSGVSPETLKQLDRLTHDEIDVLKIRLVQAPRIASFTVLPADTGLEPFHGLVDLSTNIRVSVATGTALEISEQFAGVN